MPATSLLDRAGLDKPSTVKILQRGLEGADDGELFLEYRQSEMLLFDNGRLKQATYDTAQGFGLRAVKDDAVGYAHASDMSEGAIARAADSVRAVRGNYSGHVAVRAAAQQRQALHRRQSARCARLRSQGETARGNRRLCARQGSARAPGVRQRRRIMAGRGNPAARRRNLSRHPSAGSAQCFGRRRRRRPPGNRQPWLRRTRRSISASSRRVHGASAADDAVRQALVNLEAIPAPAGEMDVVLGPGWPGVMLHEAVGHGLEGDFNRKGRRPLQA